MDQVSYSRSHPPRCIAGFTSTKSPARARQTPGSLHRTVRKDIGTGQTRPRDAGRTPGIRTPAQRGYSRDHRSDCKQVCIALVVTFDGFPLGCGLASAWPWWVGTSLEAVASCGASLSSDSFEPVPSPSEAWLLVLVPPLRTHRADFPQWAPQSAFAEWPCQTVGCSDLLGGSGSLNQSRVVR
jgi:hypothetical protein